MYYLKEEKVSELLDSRTISSLSRILGISYRYLWGIFNKNEKCKKIVAMSLINIKNGTQIKDTSMLQELDYYFENK